MAKKFFYNKVYNPKKTRIIIIIISIIVLALLLLGAYLIWKITKGPLYTCDNHIIKPKEVISVEINSPLPKVNDYFDELQCINTKYIKVDTKNVNITKLGEYNVVIGIKNEKYIVKINVVDHTAPTVKAKTLTITKGAEYKPADFIEKCVDNSNSKCNIEFYQGDLDSVGNTKDYSKYSEVGNYKVKLIVKDDNGNQAIITTELNIVEKTQNVTPVQPDPQPTENTVCQYGNLEYDTKYTLVLKLNNNNCALSVDEIKAEENKQIVTIIETETKKIQGDINQLSGLTSNLNINRNIYAIPNNENKGYVGFALHIEVTDENKNTIVSYYLKEDGTRLYENNPYNLN